MEAAALQMHGRMGAAKAHFKPEVCGAPVSGVVAEQATNGAFGVRQVRDLVRVHAVRPGARMRTHEPTAVHTLRRMGRWAASGRFTHAAPRHEAHLDKNDA